MSEEILAGTVAAISPESRTIRFALKIPMHKGDWIHVVDRDSEVRRQVRSLRINSREVEFALPGDEVEITIGEEMGEARAGDAVYVNCLARPI